MLPLGGDRYGSICTVAAADATGVAGMDDAAYRAFLQARLGWGVGRLGGPGPRSRPALPRGRAGARAEPRAGRGGRLSRAARV